MAAECGAIPVVPPASLPILPVLTMACSVDAHKTRTHAHGDGGEHVGAGEDGAQVSDALLGELRVNLRGVRRAIVRDARRALTSVSLSPVAARSALWASDLPHPCASALWALASRCTARVASRGHAAAHLDFVEAVHGALGGGLRLQVCARTCSLACSSGAATLTHLGANVR